MSIRIGIGTGLGAALSPQDHWRWVDYCEDNGIDSIWHSDQLLGQTMEPMTMLAALAARTRRMKFGTNALVVPFRDPILIAKQFATIEYLGEGRLFPVLGVGAGGDPYWNATGSSPKGRGARANEAIELIRLLLERDEVEFAGAHYRYHGPGVHPRPARPIPLWIGGNSKAAISRTARLGDGWLGSFASPEQAGSVRKAIEAALEQESRMIAPDHYGMSLLMRIGDPGDPGVIAAKQRLQARLSQTARNENLSDSLAVGSPDEIAALLKRYVTQGMSKFVVLPLANDADDLMEQTQNLVSNILSQLED